MNLCNKKCQSMNTWYKRTLTCTRSRLYQFNFKFKKAPCQTGVFYNTSKDTWRYFIPETRLGVFLSRIKQASNELAFSFFVNSTSHNHSTTLTEAGNGVFHPTEHSYAKKKKIENFGLGAIHFWSTDLTSKNTERRCFLLLS